VLRVPTNSVFGALERPSPWASVERRAPYWRVSATVGILGAESDMAAMSMGRHREPPTRARVQQAASARRGAAALQESSEARPAGTSRGSERSKVHGFEPGDSEGPVLRAGSGDLVVAEGLSERRRWALSAKGLDHSLGALGSKPRGGAPASHDESGAADASVKVIAWVTPAGVSSP